MEETNVPEAQMNDLGVFNRYKGGGNNLRGSADAAALLITHSDQWCGVGYMPNIPEDQMTSWPFQQLMSSITVTKCAIGSYTFGHEVSHNFGNDHDQYDKTTTSAPAATSTTSAPVTTTTSDNYYGGGGNGP